MARSKKPKKYYVNNKEFLAAMIDYRASVLEAAEADKKRPRVPNYIGTCIMKIATHLSYKPNFINYTFREDMINDGIENCLQYIDNFNPEKSNNPFAYFTQIIYFAFLRRIEKEKKNLYIKYKLTENANIFGLTDVSGSDNSSKGDSTVKYGEWSQEYMDTFIESFEENKRKKRQPKKTGVLGGKKT
jgi:hypothetical protein